MAMLIAIISDIGVAHGIPFAPAIASIMTIKGISTHPFLKRDKIIGFTFCPVA